ncbi:MAG: PAS domain S-box protein [Bacteroidota bacterium]
MNKDQKSNSPFSSADNTDPSIWQRALQRERKARKAAERLLEVKSKELYDASLHLREANGRLEAYIDKGDSKIESAFVNIIDPYVVMDLKSKVINMNNSAKEFLGFDHTKDTVYLSTIVHDDFLDYTSTSFKTLLEVGIIKNYNLKIRIRKYGEKFVNINASLIYDENGKPMAVQGIIRDITKEVETKELLEDQKKQQDVIVENSSLGILLVVEDKIIKANKTFVELLGYSEAELKERTIEDFSTIEDISLYHDLLENAEKGSSDKFAIVRKFHKKDGAFLWGKTSVSTVRNEKGKVDYQVVMIEDITNDKISEERLRASQQRLSTLITNLQTGVLLEDENRKMVLTNQKFCDLFEIPIAPGQLTGIDCKKYLDRYKNRFLDSDHMVKRTEYILKKRELVLSDELELLDGRTFERDYIPLFIDDVYTGHLWSYNDITLRKNYRKNLEIQKEKYSSIIANMNLGLLEIDGDRNILMANHRYSEMIGIAQDQLIGKNVLSLMNLNGENLKKIENQFERRQKNKSDSYEVEVKLATGEARHWLISAAPRYDEMGKIVGSIGVHLDITTQKELELQKQKLLNDLEESNKGLQEYAHIVSHDLKSPLRSVTALATWLHEDYKEVLDENGQYNLRMMMEKVEGMDRLIDGILKYSTVNSGVLDRRSVDVNEVVKEIKEIIYIPDHVNVICANKLPTIQADKVKIHQLFQNFLSNAVVNIEKEAGVVAVASEDVGTHWQFSIKDNGVGIPKEYHKKIFQIFQSIGNNERSTGIGLSIVKKIIDRYKGKVWLESEIGEGTTFYFTLKK